jgi:hypothetical protein
VKNEEQKGGIRANLKSPNLHVRPPGYIAVGLGRLHHSDWAGRSPHGLSLELALHGVLAFPDEHCMLLDLHCSLSFSPTAKYVNLLSADQHPQPGLPGLPLKS